MSRFRLVNAEAEPRVFTTTRWSLVLAGANADADSKRLPRRWRSFVELTGDQFFRMSAAAAIRPKMRRTSRKISS